MNVLHLEDSDADAELVFEAAAAGGVEGRWTRARNRAEFEEGVRLAPDLILADYNLPSFDGREALQIVRARDLLVPLIFVSGTIGEERVVEVLREGATDYVLKGNLGKLPFAIRRAMREVEELKRRKSAEIKYREMVESLPVVFYIRKPDETATTLFVGPQIETMLGFPPAEWTSVPGMWPRQIDPADRDQVFRAYLQALKTGTFECEYRMRHRQGRTVWVRDSARVVDGEVRGFATDTTTRKELEQRYLHVQRMEAIGQLAGGIAHDFNNILTVINGYAEILLAGIPKDQPMRVPLQEVHDAGRRALALTRQLLLLSRREASRPVPVDLNALIDQLARMLRRIIGEAVQLDLRLGPVAGSVVADPGHLEQVLMNLVVNARDAMPAGGRIGIETSQESSGTLLLRVTDTGVGMTPEVQSRLFEPFFTTKERGRGTGLGLSTVHGIVESIGGKIEVQSAPGKGTTFSLRLPLQAAEPAPAARADSPLEKGTETILIVEDDPAVRSMMRTLLEGAGYRVRTAEDGAEALRVCASARIDVVLSDVSMPVMSGIEFAERIRKTSPWMKFLFVSGYTNQEIPDGAAFLPKPFVAADLLARVREVLLS